MAPVLPRPRPLAAVLALALVPLAPVTPAVASAPGGLIAHYPLTESSGTTAHDASPSRRDAVISGDAVPGGRDGLHLGGVDGHVDLPDDLLRGLDSVTASIQVRIAPDQATPYFVWGIGNTNGSAGDGYLFTTGNAYRSSIATGNWSTEQTTGSGHDLRRDVWKTLTYTQTGSTAVLYEDGVEVGRRTDVTIRPGDIGGGSTKANHIGRSVYPGDRHLKGEVRDFRLYDRALSADEAHGLGFVPDRERVRRDSASLTIGDTSLVTEDLVLPTSGPHDTTISWHSTNPGAVSATGEVTRPRAGLLPSSALLTATTTRGDAKQRRLFAVTVRPQPTDREKVAEAVKALTVWDADDVRGNLTLPTTGLHGTTVTWTSSAPDVVTPTGEVTRPEHGQPAGRVRLTASVGSGSRTELRHFALSVTPKAERAAYEGYFFGYFTGEGSATGEQVHFAASRGNTPLLWDELNGGRPVLTSARGDRGVRDPFVIRSPEGDKFYLVATDLKIHGNGNWDLVQRKGSKHVEVWESTDLVTWSQQRHVRVAPDTAGNTWAPEAYYDESIGAYVVFWASKLYAEDDPEHTGNTYNRMLYATTRDFRTFSEPQVWVDPGYSVIDSTVIEHGGQYYRFTKDERNNTSTTPCSKFILAERSTSLRSTSYEHVADCIGKGAIERGEGPTVFKSNTEDRWYLLVDEFGGRGYVPFETTDLASGRWTPSTGYQLPARPRHGTVLPVTKAELDRLRAAFP
ncbi:family 43 glycosylhydrolase [Actinosynnema pretiosum subsp. pretiosum]|uniref:Family 43 glycosylhydrolase n=1 Tax=Actinosynnema pretiosum subsp. pretiosum TaxID=103721 RepID=A0AA45LBZ3_9PSEU|nr:endo-1,4-beta-xylanase [Actinosynnema pretiosum subsp. pretiosum]QUF06505.1 family 43 glycosylhydrolase [Actinosynnema pretiosum subsp. pretiosum]